MIGTKCAACCCNYTRSPERAKSTAALAWIAAVSNKGTGLSSGLMSKGNSVQPNMAALAPLAANPSMPCSLNLSTKKGSSIVVLVPSKATLYSIGHHVHRIGAEEQAIRSRILQPSPDGAQLLSLGDPIRRLIGPVFLEIDGIQ
jgi:hypothetical protein